MPSTIRNCFATVKAHCYRGRQPLVLAWMEALDKRGINNWTHSGETLPVLYIHTILIFISADAWVAPEDFQSSLAVSLGVMDFMLTLLLPKYSRYAGVIPNILLVLYPYIHQISRLYIFVTLANQQ
jgi:hypothetical protein